MAGIVCQDDKAVDYLEILYEKPDLRLAHIATNDNKYEQWKKYSRYLALLEKMNLPVSKD